MPGPGGNFLPLVVEQITVELVDNAAPLLDPALIQEVAAGVLHYFKSELGRTCVSMSEFAAALTEVLDAMGLSADVVSTAPQSDVRVFDLRLLAAHCGKMGELEFFSRLRALLREQLAEAPPRLEFHGLRGCVKLLAARRHWCRTCDKLEAWIVHFLRGWYAQEPGSSGVSLVVR